MKSGETRTYEVADHAWRLYRAMGHDVPTAASCRNSL
jgi:hypothetical protein